MAATLDVAQFLRSNLFRPNASITASVREPGLAIVEGTTSSLEGPHAVASFLGTIHALALPSVNARLSEAYVASLLCMILISVIISTYRSWTRTKAFQTFAQANGCARTQRELPKRFFASLRNKLHLLNKGGDLLEDVFAQKYRSFGETHALYDSAGVAKVVHTIDPVNVNAFLASRSHDYRGPANRKAILWPLAQDGVLATEGAQWLHHRKVVQRALSKGAKETKHIEAEVKLLFQAIGEPDGSGHTKVVDLLDLFFRLALDLSIQHLFGTTVDSQITGMRDRDRAAAMEKHDLVPRPKASPPPSYNEAYEVVRFYLSRRSKLGSKYWMADSPKVLSSCLCW